MIDGIAHSGASFRQRNFAGSHLPLAQDHEEKIETWIAITQRAEWRGAASATCKCLCIIASFVSIFAVEAMVSSQPTMSKGADISRPTAFAVLSLTGGEVTHDFCVFFAPSQRLQLRCKAQRLPNIFRLICPLAHRVFERRKRTFLSKAPSIKSYLESFSCMSRFVDLFRKSLGAFL